MGGWARDREAKDPRKGDLRFRLYLLWGTEKFAVGAFSWKWKQKGQIKRTKMAEILSLSSCQPKTSPHTRSLFHRAREQSEWPELRLLCPMLCFLSIFLQSLFLEFFISLFGPFLCWFFFWGLTSEHYFSQNVKFVFLGISNSCPHQFEMELGGPALACMQHI